MRKNVGGSERIVRLLVGAVLTYLAVTKWQGRARGKVAMMAGLNLLTTGSSQKCPANAVLGRDTYTQALSEDEETPRTLPI